MPPSTETKRKLLDTATQARDALQTRLNTAEVTADDLTNPKETPPVTPVEQQSIPAKTIGRVKSTLGSIRSESENARKLQEEQASFQAFAKNESGFDIQNEQLERFGVTPEKLAKLQEYELELDAFEEASKIRESRIQNAPGQIATQAGREVTQEERELAIRSASTAAKAETLRGNIELGRELAKDTVDIALQDRTFQANAQLRAIEDLKDVVDEETKQLLTAEQRKYDKELSQIEELKSSISEAITAGASQQEISLLTSDTLSDEDKIALAQQIQARTAREDRELERRNTESLIANRGSSGGSADSPTVSLTPTQERSLVEAGFNATEIEQIEADVSEFGLNTVLEGIDDESQKQAVAAAYGREQESTPATVEEVKTKIVNTLTNIKDTYTRSEAEDLARANLEKALGGSIPTAMENALQDALEEVYGATFWQNIIPGGRGNFPGTPE